MPFEGSFNYQSKDLVQYTYEIGTFVIEQYRSSHVDIGCMNLGNNIMKPIWMMLVLRKRMFHVMVTVM